MQNNRILIKIKRGTCLKFPLIFYIAVAQLRINHYRARNLDTYNLWQGQRSLSLYGSKPNAAY